MSHLPERSGSAGAGEGVSGALRAPQARGGAPGCRGRCAGSDYALGAHCCRPPALPSAEVCTVAFCMATFPSKRMVSSYEFLQGMYKGYVTCQRQIVPSLHCGAFSTWHITASLL